MTYDLLELKIKADNGTLSNTEADYILLSYKMFSELRDPAIVHLLTQGQSCSVIASKSGLSKGRIGHISKDSVVRTSKIEVKPRTP